MILILFMNYITNYLLDRKNEAICNVDPISMGLDEAICLHALLLLLYPELLQSIALNFFHGSIDNL